MSVSGDHDMKAKSPIQLKRPTSPVPSCVSMKSDWSMGQPIMFVDKRTLQLKRPASPVPSCVSMKSGWSMGQPITFADKSPIQLKRPASPVPSCVSMKSDWSMGQPITFADKSERSTDTESRCSVCEQVLRDPVSINCGHRFCRQCIIRYWEQPASSGHHDCPQCRKRSRTRPVLQHLTEPREDERGSEHMDDRLQKALENYKARLKRRYECVTEGNIKTGCRTPLNSIYTELYITEGEREGVNSEHEVWQLETASRMPTSHDTAIHCNDIFKPLPGQEKPIRTVLTKGIAGIGKTVSVQKFIVDWAEGKANQDVDVIFVLPFRELNLIRDQQYSLFRLLNDFNTDLDKHSVKKLVACKAMFIFDGLDESRLPLDFKSNTAMSDVTQKSSVDALMTNLIKGNLLPSALLWITTRPAAANQIPSECVDQMTEVRGFNDPQKEEYFRKRFSDEDLASRIISHVKTSRSLHIMCHMPVFCWILAIVLEHMLTTDKRGEMPKTLTEMFAHFLFIQTSHKNQKYHEGDEMEQEMMESDKDVLLKLAKLAFQHLEKGNLMFYEEDLKECGIDVRDASVYSGVCTEIFKEESVIFQRVVYCFVHLSIQEFLSAVYMYHCFTTQNMDALKPFIKRKSKAVPEDLTLHELLKSTVDKALESKNGHLDLFVRFLHGLSVESNQKLLRGLVTQTESSPESIQKTVRSLKVMQKKKVSPERCINLFHCLIEMKDHSVQEEIQEYLKSGKRSKNLTHAHCSALAFMLQVSEDVLDEFDLKKYKTSQEGRRRLIPAVRGCRKALLAGCKLTADVCEVISSALISNPSHLTVMDLSDNGVQDSGVKMLSAGLGHPHCKLETLRLSHCLVTEEGCAYLVSALESNPSDLKELDLSNNDLKDTGVEKFSAWLKDPQCRLETLRLSHCLVTEEGCASLVSALESNPSHLKELVLSNNDLKDTGVEKLSAWLKDPQCRLETLRLSHCRVTEEGCASLVSDLESNHSYLNELDLSNNDLKDTGVEKLSAWLKDPQCRLETLRLSGCLVTEEGCASMGSALESNPSHLKELDLSCSYTGDSSVRLLSAGLEDPHWRLEKLNMDHSVELKLKSGLERYVCDLTLDPNTVHRHLLLSEENRTVTRGESQKKEEEQLYPDHPERFEDWEQVLCREGLSGRCYWEVEKSGGEAKIAVTYKGIRRRGRGVDCWLGHNNKSWSLYCYKDCYSVRHNKKTTDIPVTPSDSHRVGVYLDWPAGTLSFYRVSSDTLTHLYTFNTTFTEPLYPGFWVDSDSSLSLCQMVPVSNTT